ncbi:hypothetical protein CAC42_1173 [Sphaceloma murrayae]|uniref:Uncharacterized protein n=1 Tax=Sphaceloma murrayae TaxID=2082308 RepID=A0A2K1R281_9PEZI|nr:hypothetical protein CAC42_1173 [Sphaceloma murrayae]
MKSAAVVAALSVIGLAAAQPSRDRVHQLLHKKHALEVRQEGVVTETVYEYVTEMTPSVTVFVDENGSILYTNSRAATTATSSPKPKPKTTSKTTPSTTLATTTSAAAPPPSSSESSSSSSEAAASAPAPAPVTQAASSSSSSSAAPVETTAAPTQSSAAAPVPTSSAAPPATNNNDPTSFRGVAYSPYKGTYGQNVNCKSTDEVKTDFDMIDASKWDVVRIYGTDCNQVANVLAAAQPKGIKLYAGVYDVSNWKSEIDIMATAIKGNWDSIHTISIGNEAVHKGMSMDTVLEALKNSRDYLRTLGYNGWVVAVDTFMVAKADPRLCRASDYSAVNMHGYWDYNTASGDVGPWMQSQMSLLKSADMCGDKPLVISETGWPSSGATKGKAVCSKEDQSKAISSIQSTLSKGFVLLAAFDDWWKNPGPDGVEQMFGLMGTAPSG